MRLQSLPLPLALFALSPLAAGNPWGSDYFPNTPLLDQDGRTVRFFDDLIKDKVVAIDFIYTSCPDVCPLETAKLRQVQEILGDRVGRDVFFLSISIDPETDTPAVLKAYADQYNIGPGWTFLTGKKADITQLRTKLGLLDNPGDAANLSGHSMSMIIGNQATGQWMKRSPYENPYVLATQLGSWLHNWNEAALVKRDYADAPKVRSITKGEELYRNRCAACHTMGDGPGLQAKRALGPDLLNVTHKRKRTWLTRWLKEPDKMLAEKDPVSVAMLAKFKNVPMPNLRLDEQEVYDLLAFIETESHRVTDLTHGPHAHGHATDHAHMPMPM